MRQIAANAGIEGSVIVEQLKKDGKVGYGYNALTGEFQDMIEAGIVDPTKVTPFRPAERPPPWLPLS